MFPRNLVLFRFSASLAASITESIDAGVDECRLKPIGPMEMSTRGFVSPYGRDSEVMVAQQGGVLWLTIGGEDKILPAAAVNEALAKKLEEIERKEGRKPGGRTRKRLKDEIITDLLPRALVKPSRTNVLLDLVNGVAAIDTSSRKVGENAVSEVRRALGSFPALPLNAEVAPRSVLTSWVAGEALPDGLSLGEECELRDPIDQGGVVKCQRMGLADNAEIDKHLQSGKQVTRLALNLDDHVSFVFGEDLVIRKFKLLDGAVDQLENADVEDLRAELDARFALMIGEFRRLFPVLEGAFKLSKVEG